MAKRDYRGDSLGVPPASNIPSERNMEGLAGVGLFAASPHRKEAVPGFPLLSLTQTLIEKVFA
ncbi:MAG: hypothetical protein RIE59_24340 [Imperialibacter sp.]